MTPRRYRLALVALLAAALFVRLGYLVAQAHGDPQLVRPMLDGAVYAAWARSLATGHGSPAGAFYLAPLYPFLLAALWRFCGEGFVLPLALQHLATLGTAALLAAVSRRAAGEVAGLATAALVVLYGPLLFFASRPMGETVAILLLAAALWALGRPGEYAFLGAGLLLGAGALARPNLLLVGAGWVVVALLARRWRAASLLVLGMALAVAPVAARNVAASRRLVAISSNGGITLYHGNGPGASGIFTLPDGFSGDATRQRDEATALARARTGRPLDAVEADRFWGSEARKARLDDPAGSIVLLAKRVALLGDDYEHSLDYAPELDANPWRHAAPLGFAVLLGLTASGLATSRGRGTGGAAVWSAIAAAAATPLFFYVSSRYRLPAAALLTVPAGIGAARLSGGPLRGAAVGLVAAAISFAIPSASLARAEEAAALANRASAYLAAGNPDAAEADARRALARDAGSTPARYNLGVILEARDRKDEAETAYRETLARDPGAAEAAGNLARLLVLRGASAEAVPVLRSALARRPTNEACWSNLVVAYLSLGRADEGRAAVLEAARAGVTIAPDIAAAAEAAR